MASVKSKVVSVRLNEEEQGVAGVWGGTPGRGLYAAFLRLLIHQHWSSGEPIRVSWVRQGVHEVQSSDHGPFVPWEDGWGVVRWLMKHRERLVREVAAEGGPPPPLTPPSREQLRLPMEGGSVLPSPGAEGVSPSAKG